MAAATGMYAPSKLKLVNGAIDLDTDTFKGFLVTNTYTPNFTTHDFRDDANANEVGNSGTYSAGGSTLASVTSVLSGTEARWDFADPSWTGATITARALITYKNVGTAATDPIITSNAFPADVASTAGTYSVQIDATGALGLA